MKKNKNQVEQFLDEMKKPFPEAVQFMFYRGFCYWLSFILSDRFKGEIWFNPKIVHFACMIDEYLYDIYGKVNPGYSPVNGEYDGSEDYWVSWEEFQLNNHETAEKIIQSCIKKVGD